MDLPGLTIWGTSYEGRFWPEKNVFRVWIGGVDWWLARPREYGIPNWIESNPEGACSRFSSRSLNGAKASAGSVQWKEGRLDGHANLVHTLLAAKQERIPQISCISLALSPFHPFGR